jgi:hypothetical protein
MTTRDMTASAVVYFHSRPSIRVSVEWAATVETYFHAFGLSIREFAVETTDKSLEGLCPYNESLNLLRGAIIRDCVTTLGLYCNPNREHDLVMDWYALGYADLEYGNIFLGLPQSLMRSLPDLLVTLTQQADLLTDCSYGIAYYHERLKGPDFFAVGMVANKLAFDPEGIERGRRVGRWMDEMRNPRRYLRGWFRGAYPASLLSESHVNTILEGGVTLRHSGLGAFSPLPNNRWLWELSEAELSIAEAALDRAGILVK